MHNDFFIIIHDMLTSRLYISEFHCIKDARVPLMRFKLAGISIDLRYPQLVPENVDILNPYVLKGIDETSWRSSTAVHADKCIIRLLAKLEVSNHCTDLHTLYQMHAMC